MKFENKNFKYFLTIALGYLLIAMTANLQAEEDIEDITEENSDNQEMSSDTSELDKCMMKAKY